MCKLGIALTASLAASLGLTRNQCSNGVGIEGAVTDPVGAIIPGAQVQSSDGEKTTTDPRAKYVLPCASRGTVSVQVEAGGGDPESQGAQREMDRSRMPRPRAILGEFPCRHRPASGRQPGRSSSCADSRPRPRIESKNTDAAAATNEISQLVVRRGSDVLQAATAITTILTPLQSTNALDGRTCPEGQALGTH
jgi:hypothetical protein